MKKSLIALAIASAVSAPAFAATSNVDIYGVLNMSLNYVDTDVPNSDNSLSVTSTASRIGFKGTEDLGGGLAAIWQIESGFNADEQSGTLASRNTFVGLNGGFGTVLMGNHDTPMKMMGRMVDNFGDTLGDSRNILGSVGNGGTTTAGKNLFDLRTKNTIAYVSPNWSGLSFVAAYVADWSTSSTVSTCPAGAPAVGPTPSSCLDNNSADAYSISGVYNNGPLMLGAAYEAHNGTLSNTNADIWRIVAGYDFAGFKLAGAYEQTGGDIAAYKRDAYGLFASYKLGAWNLKGNYMAASESDAVGGNDGADQWTIGADYALSKRTVAYGLYARTSNDQFGGYGLGAGAGSSDQTIGNLGSNPSTFSMGVKHSF
jgi:predicted porin